MAVQNQPTETVAWPDGHTAVEALLEHPIRHRPGDIATVPGHTVALAMQIERAHVSRASPCEGPARCQGDASGHKPERIDTPAGTVIVEVPGTADHGHRSTRNRWSAGGSRCAP